MPLLLLQPACGPFTSQTAHQSQKDRGPGFTPSPALSQDAMASQATCSEATKLGKPQLCVAGCVQPTAVWSLETIGPSPPRGLDSRPGPRGSQSERRSQVVGELPGGQRLTLAIRKMYTHLKRPEKDFRKKRETGSCCLPQGELSLWFYLVFP